jgi:hypothetical protein
MLDAFDRRRAPRAALIENNAPAALPRGGAGPI